MKIKLLLSTLMLSNLQAIKFPNILSFRKNQVEQLAPEKTCSICFDEFNTDKPVNSKIFWNCGHNRRVCSECMQTCVNEEQTCPLCRAEIKQNELKNWIENNRPMADFYLSSSILIPLTILDIVVLSKKFNTYRYRFLRGLAGTAAGCISLYFSHKAIGAYLK